MPDLRYDSLRTRANLIMDDSLTINSDSNPEEVEEMIELFVALVDDLLEAYRGALIPGLSEAWVAAKAKGVPVTQLYKFNIYKDGKVDREEWTAYSGTSKSATAATPQLAILKLAGETL